MLIYILWLVLNLT